MKSLDIDRKLASYPPHVRKRIARVRELILKIVQKRGLEPLEETLKWGEPSYIVKSGSTVRVDWKPNRPETYAVYFHCQTKLVDTFRELYPDEFEFEGNRALVLAVNKAVNERLLEHCLELALTYHQVKHLPLLGASPLGQDVTSKGRRR